MSIRCKNTEPYVDREFASPLKFFVYNKNTGLIVAAAVDRKMADAILAGLDITNIYQDGYAICEMWEAPQSRF